MKLGNCNVSKILNKWIKSDSILKLGLIKWIDINKVVLTPDD